MWEGQETQETYENTMQDHRDENSLKKFASQIWLHLRSLNLYHFN